MIVKVIFLILFLYFLALAQITFLVPHLIFVVVGLINLFEDPRKKLGIWAGFLGGLYLDIFSISPLWFFGFYLLVCLILAFFIKFVLRKYVQIPVIKKI